MAPDDLNKLADEDLMPILSKKVTAAFEALYDRHGASAFSLAYRMLGDRQAAEDVSQEAFLSIWRSGERWDRARGSVRTWILGIVRNRAIDQLRHRQSRVPRLDADDDAALEQEEAAETTAGEVARRERATMVRGALAELPEDQGQVIGLAFFGGFTHREIADMLGTPLGTVKGRMRLGMEKIRAQIGEGLMETP